MNGHNIPIALGKNLSENPKKMEKLHNYLRRCIDNMKTKQTN